MSNDRTQPATRPLSAFLFARSVKCLVDIVAAGVSIYSCSLFYMVLWQFVKDGIYMYIGAFAFCIFDGQNI
jgi:hypothetical protein